MSFFSLKLAALLCLLALTSCSSSNNLRKFDEGDLSNAAPADTAKKFQVKEVGADSVAPTPTPALVVTQKKKKSKTKKEKQAMATPTPEAPIIPPVRRVDPLPFSVGEKLEYGIRYMGVTAGYFNLEVLPFKELNGRKVFHFQAKVKTVKLFELIYRVDDTVESFWDYDGLFSYKFTMDLDESKQNRKLIELYDYDKKKSFYWNRVDHIQKGFSEKKESYDISLWSQDPMSILYYLRASPLPTDTNVETRLPLILDGKPWEGVVRFLNKEKIYAGGKYRDANVYKFDSFQNGEAKIKGNKVWISDDQNRYVLRVEAKVKIGTFAIALDRIL
jgi:hypothetical protein